MKACVLYTVYHMGRGELQIRRTNLSEEIADVVRKMIFDSKLAPGERINEVHLAEKLGVSRTPLRECLAAMAEGLLEFFVG